MATPELFAAVFAQLSVSSAWRRRPIEKLERNLLHQQLGGAVSCDRSWSVLIEATDSTDCLDGYPQALRIVRLKRVSALCPGAVRTPAVTGGKYGRTHRYREEGLRNMAERGRPITPEKFAKRAIRAVLRGDAIIVIPAWWKAWWYLERLSPTLSMRFAKIVMLKPMRAIEADAS